MGLEMWYGRRPGVARVMINQMQLSPMSQVIYIWRQLLKYSYYFWCNDYYKFGFRPFSSDIFLTKIDALGNVLWANGAGTSSYDNASCLSIDAANQYCDGGSFNGAAISFVQQTLSNSGADAVFAVKYNPSGSVIWAVTSDTGNTSITSIVPN